MILINPITHIQLIIIFLMSISNRLVMVQYLPQGYINMQTGEVGDRQPPSYKAYNVCTMYILILCPEKNVSWTFFFEKVSLEN